MIVDEQRLDERQRRRQELFKSVSARGRMIRYFNKSFIVYRNTFWPFQDSVPLVRRLKIKETDRVLDIGTGSGVIAVFACLKGAKEVIATDISRQAVKSARKNAELHGCSKTMRVIQSDVFQKVPRIQFDVITANLPFRNKPASNLVARTQWDTSLLTHRKFFKGLPRFLKENGRVYLAQANFGPLKEVRDLVKKAGFKMKFLDSKLLDGTGPETFYAFLLTRNRLKQSRAS